MGIKTYKNIPRVYFDMDGVLADFEKYVQEHGGKHNIVKNIIGTYINLEVLEGSKEAINTILEFGYDIFVCSKPPKENSYAVNEKYQWLNIHFPEFKDRIIITPDKGCIGTVKDYLIDDHPEWANANNFPGKVLEFKGNWTYIIMELYFNAKKNNMIV